MNIKVGDKIRVTNAFCSEGYKNGDVLEVIALEKDETGVYVRTPYNTNIKGLYADREIQQPFSYLLEKEFEVIESKPQIKVGDTVRLIDKFYEHEAFRREPRIRRKSIASLRGIKFDVSYINKASRVSGTCKIAWSIPVELLRKVESRLDGKNADFACIDDLPYTKHRYTNRQVREAQRIIGEIVAGFREGECFYVLDVTTHGIAIRYRTGMYDCYERFDSHCSPHDEFNRTIGIMVALCRAVGRKLPDWI